MRELTAAEKDFLEAKLQSSVQGVQEQQAVSRGWSPVSRLRGLLKPILAYLPLTIGLITLMTASLAVYLYLWGKELFKIAEVKSFEEDGTIALMDSTAAGWFDSILHAFALAPWLILAIVIVGVALMGTSMLIIGKMNREEE